MKLYFILAGIMAILLGSAQADSLYRWVDQSGNVHYGDMPPVGTIQAEEVKINVPPAADDADLPYETRRARENFPVTLYVANNCIDTCQKARDFLNQRGIPFTEKNLESKEEVDAFRQVSGGEKIPAVTIGKNWFIGFLAEQWGSELDFAGYPATAPHRFTAPVKKPVTPLVASPAGKPVTENEPAVASEPVTENEPATGSETVTESEPAAEGEAQ